ncbi:MAG TPA: ABC transporter permease [Vicinamibacteria bacterium]|nr:ABC transporter permease [Vicinamibacteria bacterium]
MVEDARTGIRRLAAAPGFTLVAVVTLAVGIGANAAVFSILNQALLRSLPYPDADTIVFVRDIQPQLRDLPGSYPEYLDWKELTEVFDDVGAYWRPSANLTGETGPERVEVVRLTPNLLRMMGVEPLAGRILEDDDDVPGAERVALLGYALWQRRYGGDRNVLGRAVLVNGEQTTIVGVLPPDERVQTPNELRRQSEPELWLPLRRTVEDSPRGSHYLTVVARLGAGVALEQAEAEIERNAEALKQDGRTDHGIILVSLNDRIRGRSRTSVLMLMGAVGFVLLIACANIANLVLARSSGRARELALRSALGASRSRLVRGALVETSILAVGGGLAGVALSTTALKMFSTSPGAALLGSGHVSMDATALGFSLGLVVLAGLLFGSLPALRAGSVDAGASLKEGGRELGPSESRGLGKALVIAEVALALMLLAGAGLLIESFQNLLDEELGFDPENLLTFTVALPAPVYDTHTKQAAFFDEVLERIGALPGVEGTGMVTVLPTEGGWNSDFDVEGIEWPDGHSPLAETRSVSPDYFRTMRIPVVEGRSFLSSDTSESANIVVVNRELVRQVFSTASPIGRRITFGDTGPHYTIVGVVGNVQQWSLGEEKRPAIYWTHRQNLNSTSMVLVARTTGDPLGYVPAIREELRQVDPNQPLSRIRTMEAVLANGLARRGFSTAALAVFAGLALFLACLGLYGIVTQTVGQRTQEFGLRMTLGARGSDILGLVIVQGGKLTGIGLVLGLVGAALVSRLLESFLFGVGAADPIVYAEVSLVLVVVAAVALYLPARRASRVDPMISLRAQ